MALAVTFTGCALAFFVADHSLNVQNVVMGLAAVVSIASLIPRGHDSAAAKPNIARHL